MIHDHLFFGPLSEAYCLCANLEKICEINTEKSTDYCDKIYRDKKIDFDMILFWRLNKLCYFCKSNVMITFLSISLRDSFINII